MSFDRAIVDELAPVYRERFARVAGGELRVLEGGAGSPLVLLHGRGSAATMWLPLLRDLARRHRVLAVDLPGFGSSRGYRFAGGDFERGIAFFVDPIEAWLASEGLDAFCVAGHSLGGFVAIELALRRRARPAAIALIAAMGTGPEITTPARLFFRAHPERLARALGPRLFARLVPGALSYELAAIPEGRADAAAAFDTLVPLIGPAPHRRARLAEIDVPVLVLWGEHDEALPAPLAIAASGALPKGVLQIVPAGHSPHIDDPPGIARLLGDFFEKSRV
jgi:pimeloyl-ACP methyl ester carboxylesterase